LQLFELHTKWRNLLSWKIPQNDQPLVQYHWFSSCCFVPSKFDKVVENEQDQLTMFILTQTTFFSSSFATKVPYYCKIARFNNLITIKLKKEKK
jgi:hypothetical protein